MSYYTDKYGYVVFNGNNASDFGADPSNIDNHTEIQNAIDDVHRVLIIGTTDDVYVISKPLSGVSDKTIIIEGEIKIDDANVKSLEEDLSIGGSSTTITDASLYFQEGQHIGISDDNRSIEGGGNGKDRREAQPLIITDITGDVITFNTTFVFNYLQTENSEIGQMQSVMYFDNCDNYKIDGTGTLNGNKANLFYKEPNPRDMATDGNFERFGSGLSHKECGEFIVNGITIKNALVQNQMIYSATNWEITEVKHDASYDKSFLIYGDNLAKNLIGKINSCEFTNSVFEDGISGYNFGEGIEIRDCIIRNCGRFGLYMTASLLDIDIYDITIENCGIGFYCTSNDVSFHGSNKIEGAGRYSNAPTVIKPSVFLSNIDNGKLENCSIDVVSKDAQLIYIGDCDGWTLENIVLEYTDGIALQMVSTSAKTATLKNSQLTDNGTNYDLDANSTLIKDNVIET